MFSIPVILILITYGAPARGQGVYGGKYAGKPTLYPLTMEQNF